MGKISGALMQGEMYKSLFSSILNNDIPEVIINLGFIGSNYAIPQLANLVSLKSSKYIGEGKLLLGKSLQYATPFLFSIYISFLLDMIYINKLKAYNNNNNKDALIPGTVLVGSLWSAVKNDPNRLVSFGFIAGIILLHTLLAVAFKEFYFDTTMPSADTTHIKFHEPTTILPDLPTAAALVKQEKTDTKNGSFEGVKTVRETAASISVPTNVVKGENSKEEPLKNNKLPKQDLHINTDSSYILNREEHINSTIINDAPNPTKPNEIPTSRISVTKIPYTPSTCVQNTNPYGNLHIFCSTFRTKEHAQLVGVLSFSLFICSVIFSAFLFRACQFSTYRLDLLYTFFLCVPCSILPKKFMFYFI